MLGQILGDLESDVVTEVGWRELFVNSVIMC